MYDDVLAHLAYKISNAEVRPYPAPHIYVEDVFPADFYDQIQKGLPTPDAYSKGESNYKGRIFHDPVDMPIFGCLRTPEWLHIACYPFRHDIAKHHGASFDASTDLRLVLDGENYAIGPHTDAKFKVLSFLFYLPPNYDLSAYGTSIYLPKDPKFRCAGGPHHKHEAFNKVWTAPFYPNSLFAFYKTDFSFHGVEPITIPCRRDVLLWNLYDRGK